MKDILSKDVAKASEEVLLVCSSIGGGGAEKVAVNISSEMVKNGLRVTIFYWDDKVGEEYNLSPSINRIRYPGRSFMGRVLALASLVRRSRFDAAIGFTDISNIILSIALLSSPYSLVRVSTIHTDLIARDAFLKGEKVKRDFLRFLHSRACRSSDYCVAVSNGATQSAIKRLGLSPSKTKTIYNPVLERVSSVQHCNRITTPIRIVAAGRLTEAKDYPTMIRALREVVFSEHIECSLDIYGDGPLRNQLEALVSELGLTKHVFFRGFVGDLEAKLPEYDIFLLSSRWEGFSNVLVEALSSGLFVISTDCPSGPREILKNGDYGILVPTESPLEMSGAIVRLLRDKHYRPKMNGLSAHLQNFTTSVATCRYICLVRTGAK